MQTWRHVDLLPVPLPRKFVGDVAYPVVGAAANAFVVAVFMPLALGWRPFDG